MTRNEDWIPLNELHADNSSGVGGVFLDDTGMGVQIIQVREDKPNDVVKLYSTEVSDLIKRLVECMDDTP